MAKYPPRPYVAPKAVWRDLKCTECNQVEGFTRADLDMNKDYVMNYYCHHCQKPTVREFVGPLYARDGKMQRIQDVLDFEVAS